MRGKEESGLWASRRYGLSRSMTTVIPFTPDCIG